MGHLQSNQNVATENVESVKCRIMKLTAPISSPPKKVVPTLSPQLEASHVEKFMRNVFLALKVIDIIMINFKAIFDHRL